MVQYQLRITYKSNKLTIVSEQLASETANDDELKIAGHLENIHLGIMEKVANEDDAIKLTISKIRDAELRVQSDKCARCGSQENVGRLSICDACHEDIF